MVRTIEQILGAQPLNEKVAAATPMFGAFTNKPNTSAFNAVPNRIPLTEGIATQPSCGPDNPGATKAAPKAGAGRTVPAAERGVASQWAKWAQHQHFTGNGAVPDFANPEQMNRYTWYRANNWHGPYPGDSKIYAPSRVPGAYLPSAESN
jgi:hypothetical protein